ncbi:MAG: WYL domain-containing protein, partial [Acidimicrobiales bacterium]
PLAMYSKDGHWYLVGYCNEAQAQRTFRIDRFVEVELSGDATHLADRSVSTAGFIPDDAVQRVRLRLPIWAKQLLDQVPVEDSSEDGEMYEVTLAVTGEAWLEQILLRVGPEAEVLDPPELRDVASSAAQRLLSKYAQG